MKIIFLGLFLCLLKCLKASQESEAVILLCPRGWLATGQAWYAPPPQWDPWRSGVYNALVGPEYNHLLRSENENYRPKNYSICLLCQRDSLYQNLPQNWIEICITKHLGFFRKGKIHFEKQSCENALAYNKFNDETMYW